MHFNIGYGRRWIYYWDFKAQGAAGSDNCMAWNENIVGNSWFTNLMCKFIFNFCANTTSCFLWRVGFLEPPAFEEGILDRHPIFLSIVLNHISDDSVEFSHAVNCLKLLFEKLGKWSYPYLVIYLNSRHHLLILFSTGYKLWLRATLSPGVMRNTLLGQCFHTRNEKIHKEIFDLFQPLLQACFFCCVCALTLTPHMHTDHEIFILT